MLGGSIQLSSVRGIGTKFWFQCLLDIAPSSAAHEQSQTPSQPSLDIRGRILVAEDSDINLKVVTAMLERMGQDYEIARNGVEALHRASHEDFDLILMDCQMPLMDGYEATRRIRQTLPPPKNRIPILATTAFVTQTEFQKCIDSGMNDFVAKPLSYPDLVEKIRTLLLFRTTSPGSVAVHPPMIEAPSQIPTS